MERRACLPNHTTAGACSCNTKHVPFGSGKCPALRLINVAHRRDNSCGRRIVLLQVLTGFLIYDWIEKPHKQEVIKEVLSLLEQKILEPNSGEAHLMAPVFFHSFLFTGFSPYFSRPTPFLHTIFDHKCLRSSA